MAREERDKIYELLKRGIRLIENGDDLPSEWARELFPPERREYEIVYSGKESEEQILADTMAVPLQPVSTFGNSTADWQNKLIFGDNLQALKTLVSMKERGELINADGSHGVRLVYIDPPFATKREFRGSQDAKAYQDKIAGAEFLEFLRKRLILLKEVLADNGGIFVHLDWKKAHYMKVLMDEIFGENHFRNEIVWYYRRWNIATNLFARNHDTILYYTKSDKRIFNNQFIPKSEKSSAQGKAWKSVIDENGVRRSTLSDEPTKGVPMPDVWEISMINPVGKERTEIDYPTQKPEALLERIITASTNEGDIVLDAFAGSGTTCAVAERMKRSWIGIDCGKLAIYTIQKRMLNLVDRSSKTPRRIEAQPFTLYNAGLYDFETLRQLPWEDWRAMSMQLFECRIEPHKVKGFQMDGKRQGSSVFVFDHFKKGAISRETVTDLHASIGKQVGERCFIIAPRGAFLFQEDYIELDGVRYYALRIPYSYINELHRREFSALTQPIDETSVNETVDAVGFDFIQPPVVEMDSITRGETTSIKIKKFESRARLKGKEKVTKFDGLSMVMVDLDYNGKVFDLDKVFYASELKSKNWQLELPKREGEAMLVFLDIYGNESRVKLESEKPQKKPKVSRTPARTKK